MASSKVSRSRAHAARAPQVDASSSSSASTAVASATQTSSTSSVVSSSGLSHGTITAIVAVIVVVAVLVFGYALYRWIQFRREKKQVAPSTLAAKDMNNEKTRGNIPSYLDLENGVLRTQQPNKAVILPLAPPSPDTHVGWVPQIKPWMSQASPVSAGPSSKTEYGLSAKEQEVMANMETSEVQTPPPVYADNRAPSFAAPASTLPTPPPGLNLNITVPAVDATTAALPSPRTASMQKSPATPKPQSKRFSIANGSNGKGKQAPRLMTVETEFLPSMDDELAIRVGETLRLLEEYEDEWCFVQRVGGHDAETGVVPRLCLVERADIVPRTTHTPQTPSYSSSASGRF